MGSWSSLADRQCSNLLCLHVEMGSCGVIQSLRSLATSHSIWVGPMVLEMKASACCASSGLKEWRLTQPTTYWKSQMNLSSLDNCARRTAGSVLNSSARKPVQPMDGFAPHAQTADSRKGWAINPCETGLAMLAPEKTAGI